MSPVLDFLLEMRWFPFFLGDVTRLGDLPYLETPDECVNMLNEQCSKPLLFMWDYTIQCIRD